MSFWNKVKKWNSFLLCSICFLSILISVIENYKTFKMVILIVAGLAVVIVFVATIMEMRTNKDKANC